MIATSPELLPFEVPFQKVKRDRWVPHAVAGHIWAFQAPPRPLHWGSSLRASSLVDVVWRPKPAQTCSRPRAGRQRFWSCVWTAGPQLRGAHFHILPFLPPKQNVLLGPRLLCVGGLQSLPLPCPPTTLHTDLVGGFQVGGGGRTSLPPPPLEGCRQAPITKMA